MPDKRVVHLAIGTILVCFAPAPSVSEYYYGFVEGGVAWSFDRSNQNEVEFGDEAGGSIALGVGRRFRFDERWLVGVEGQLIGQTLPLHGRNDKREATADGRFFWLTGTTINAWPELVLDERWSLYVGGGLGPAVIIAFGSSAPTLLVIGGGGARYQVADDLGLDIGGRYYWTAPARLNGAESKYDSFGPSLRLIWNFE